MKRLTRLIAVAAALSAPAFAAHAQAANPDRPDGEWRNHLPFLTSPAAAWDATSGRLWMLSGPSGSGVTLWNWDSLAHWRAEHPRPLPGYSSSTSSTAFDPIRRRFLSIVDRRWFDSLIVIAVPLDTSADVVELGAFAPVRFQGGHVWYDPVRDELVALESSDYGEGKVFRRAAGDLGTWRPARTIPALPDYFSAGLRFHDPVRDELLLTGLHRSVPFPVELRDSDSLFFYPLVHPDSVRVIRAPSVIRRSTPSVVHVATSQLFVVISDRELWSLNLADGRTWTRWPDPPRDPYGASLIAGPDGRSLWLLGGWRTQSSQAEVDRLDIATRTWTRLGAPELPMLFSASLLWDPVGRRPLLFGGFRGDMTGTNEVWEPTPGLTGQWQRVRVEGEPPPARGNALFLLDPLERRAVLFGGTASRYGYGTPLSDTWTLTLDPPLRWSRVATTGGPLPPMWYPGGAVDIERRRLLIVSGGQSPGRYSADGIWSLSLEGSPEWTPLVPIVNGHYLAPQPRVVKVGDDRLVLPGVAGRVAHELMVLRDSLRWEPWPTDWSALEWWHAAGAAIWDPVGDRIVRQGDDRDEPGYIPTAAVITVDVGDTLVVGIVHPNGHPVLALVHHTAVYDPIADRMLIWCGTGGLTSSLEWSRTDRATPWSVSAGADGVSLDFLVVGLVGRTFQLQRRDAGVWRTIAMLGADSDHHVRFADRTAVTGGVYAYRLAWQSGTMERFTTTVWSRGPTPTGRLAMAGVWPNPSRGEPPTLAFSLPDDSPARIELFDIAGRRVWSRAASGAGRRTLTVDAALRPGLYVASVTQGARRATARVVVVR